MDGFAEVNGIRLHYIDHGGGGTPLLMMPGLTGNAHAFDGLVAAGLGRIFRLIVLDLRGRGMSDKPETGYTLEDHAEDVAQFIRRQALQPVILGGHSFGGLLALYLARRNPDLVSRLVVLDAAAAMHPRTRELIQPAIDRLERGYPSWEAFVGAVRRFPCYDGWWAPAIESYLRADVEPLPGGGVIPRSPRTAIEQAVDAVLAEPWEEHLPHIRHPLLLINGPAAFGPPGTPPVLPPDQAMATVKAVECGSYLRVPGNHMTMLYGEGARASVAAIETFALTAPQCKGTPGQAPGKTPG